MSGNGLVGVMMAVGVDGRGPPMCVSSIYSLLKKSFSSSTGQVHGNGTDCVETPKCKPVPVMICPVPFRD